MLLDIIRIVQYNIICVEIEHFVTKHLSVNKLTYSQRRSIYPIHVTYINLRLINGSSNINNKL